MAQPPIFISWTITCESAADARSLQNWLAEPVNLDRVVTDRLRVMPSGVAKEEIVEHRLGDFFSAIRFVADNHGNPSAFRVQFEPRTDAGRYWKDLMVNLLQEIEAGPIKASIAFEAKRAPHEAMNT